MSDIPRNLVKECNQTISIKPCKFYLYKIERVYKVLIAERSEQNKGLKQRPKISWLSLRAVISFCFGNFILSNFALLHLGNDCIRKSCAWKEKSYGVYLQEE